MTIHTPTKDEQAFAADFAKRLSDALSAALTGFGEAHEDRPAVTIQPAATATAPAQLAKAHPGGPKARQQAQALYTRCLAHYREKVQQGLPMDDVGAAAAYFVLANLAALQDLTVTEPQLALVERQMRHVIGRHEAWSAADAKEQQSLFEQFAVLGVLVGESQAEARKQGPAAIANVRRAARGYIVQLLGLNPDALRLTDKGLSLQTDVALPAAANDGA
jgi:hypothetical protein